MCDIYEQIAAGVYVELRERLVYREYHPGGFCHMHPRSIVLEGRLIEVLPFGTRSSPFEILMGDRHCTVRLMNSNHERLVEYAHPDFMGLIAQTLLLGQAELVTPARKQELWWATTGPAGSCWGH